MRIKQISVNGLFGIFDHVIPLNIDERITIIHGPNGFGKTAILRIINGFFNSKYFELRTIPFSKFRVEFDDQRILEIVKFPEDLEVAESGNIKVYFNKFDLEETLDFELRGITIRSFELESIINIFNEIVPNLKRISVREWLYLPTEETLSLEEVLVRFKDIFPSNLKSYIISQDDPEWLEELKKDIHIRLIESQRLLNFVPNLSSIEYRGTPPILSTVSAYSKELAELMQDKFKQYGLISQVIDRTFPARVVKQQPSSDLTNQQLRERLSKLEVTRSRLIEVGLLDKDEDAEFQIQPQDIDESTKNALSVYVEDVEKKLDVFTEIANKIDLLKTIINKKFAYSYKEINFSKEKGFVFTTKNNLPSSKSKNLSPKDLSSGEQHELVLLYELLFKVEPNSLVLIDEPELSLHVGWQVEFLKDLQEIIKLADLDILMATHSPDIIQDRWDLTVELKGLGN